MELKKLLRDWLHSGPDATKVEGKEYNGASNFSHQVYVYNVLLVRMIKIQGLERTLEDIKGMTLLESFPGALTDELCEITWKALLELHKVGDR